MIEDVERLVRPHVKEVINRFRPPLPLVGTALHIIYKKDQFRNLWLNGAEVMLPNGVLVRDIDLAAVGLDASVEEAVKYAGFVYLGIGIIHKF